MKHFTLTGMAFLFAFYLTAQSDYTLKIKNGDFIPNENLTSYIQSPNVTADEIYNGNYYRILQFNEIPTQAEKEAMENMGIDLLEYLPHYAFIVALPENFESSRLSSLNIRSVEQLLPQYKFSVALSQNIILDHAYRNDGKDVAITVAYHDNVSPALAVRELHDYKIEWRYDYDNLLTIVVPKEDIYTIASLPFISYVELVPENPQPENIRGVTNAKVNVLTADGAVSRKYDGTGITIAMGDDGEIGPHIDYTGRFDNSHVTGYDQGTHGDHIAGTTMGAGNLDPTMKGFAPGAFLYAYKTYTTSSSGWDAVDEVPTSYNNAEKVRVTTTSYGESYSSISYGQYSSTAVTADKHIRDYPSLMHVFSAGNKASSNGYATFYGNITGGRKAGKNVMAIGGNTNLDVWGSYSSKGPAQDGRIKPDMTMTGSSVVSTMPGQTYDSKTGTSHSSPAGAGLFASIMHAYKDNNSGSEPKSGLIKAILMNTAEDLGEPGPDYQFGYGRGNGLRAAECVENKQYITASISQGETNTHDVVVPANTKQVKIMCYWTDYEGTKNASIALINDLDMIVKDPSNKSYDPWILSLEKDRFKLDDPATRGKDDLNNVEQVTLDDPAAGTYSVEIDGDKIPQGPQEYFLIYTFIMDEVVVTYPYGGEGFAPGSTERIRWDAFDNTSSFTLEYSTDGGSSWNSIGTAAKDDRYEDWTVPSTITADAKIRITRSGVSGTSGAFSIMDKPDNLTIAWACPTIFRLEWDAVSGADKYEPYILGSEYMESQGQTSNTYYDFNNVNATDEFWVAVRAIGPNGETSRRTIAVKKDPGTFSCPPWASVEENDLAKNISIYPNPSNGIFNFAIYELTNEEVNIKVSDLQGRIVWKESFDSTSKELNGQIDLTNYSKGMYLIEVQTGNIAYQTKLNKF